jgi:proline iminopeptidase
MKKLSLNFSLILITCVIYLTACQAPASNTQNIYHDTTGRNDILSGGVQLIPIQTDKGVFNVWTKRVGNNPKIKVLLLHGGPGATHEYFECFDSFLPAEGIEYYYYDQLGSAYSDNPNDSSLWNLPRFVEEVETVRKALGMDSTEFFLIGTFLGRYISNRVCFKIPTKYEGYYYL